MSNQITISRNDQGNYVVTDYMGTVIFEQIGNALRHIQARLESQDIRIAEYRRNLDQWHVNGISELTC